jgi:hypothetical protein
MLKALRPFGHSDMTPATLFRLAYRHRLGQAVGLKTAPAVATTLEAICA